MSEAAAAYADATFHVGEKLFLTAGARYSSEKKHGSYFEMPGSVAATLSPPADKKATFSAFTPRGVIRYEIADRTNIYGSVSRGFRTGTFPVTSFPNPALYNPIKPERITAYEVGFKTASSTFRFDAAGYYYDFKNIQVGLTVPIRWPRPRSSSRSSMPRGHGSTAPKRRLRTIRRASWPCAPVPTGPTRATPTLPMRPAPGSTSRPNAM